MYYIFIIQREQTREINNSGTVYAFYNQMEKSYKFTAIIIKYKPFHIRKEIVFKRYFFYESITDKTQKFDSPKRRYGGK